MPSKFLIYGLVDPRDGQLRCVLATKKGLKSARKAVNGSLKYKRSPRGRWTQELLADGLSPELVVLEELQPLWAHENLSKGDR